MLRVLLMRPAYILCELVATRTLRRLRRESRELRHQSVGIQPFNTQQRNAAWYAAENIKAPNQPERVERLFAANHSRVQAA
jgi:hypothetical protein